MDEVLLNRRYCRFRNRKSKQKSRMNDDGNVEVNFKVRRFIEDIGKFEERRKKKKARKEASLMEGNNVLLANKGIYKNAVLSHPGIKALFNESTNARLKGDLIALSKKNTNRPPNTLQEIISHREVATENAKNIANESPQMFREADGSCEFDVLEDVENINFKETIQSDIDGAPSERVEQVVQQEIQDEIRAKLTLVSDEPKVDLHESSVLMLHNQKNESKEFFDFLIKTPEKRISSNFPLLNSPQFVSPKWENFNSNCFQQNQKTSTPNIGCQKLFERPQDYITKRVSPKNDSHNDVQLFNCNRNYLDDFDPNNIPVTSSRANRRIASVPFLLDDGLFTFQSNKELTKHSDDVKIYRKYFDDFSSINLVKKTSPTYSPIQIPAHTINENFFGKSLNGPNLSMGYDRMYNRDSREHKFAKTNLNYKKYLNTRELQEHIHLRNLIKSKNDPHQRRKKPTIFTNIRFKSNLKFSPHKYC